MLLWALVQDSVLIGCCYCPAAALNVAVIDNEVDMAPTFCWHPDNTRDTQSVLWGWQGVLHDTGSPCHGLLASTMETLATMMSQCSRQGIDQVSWLSCRYSATMAHDTMPWCAASAGVLLVLVCCWCWCAAGAVALLCCDGIAQHR
jgi:hypothetical protein